MRKFVKIDGCLLLFHSKTTKLTVECRFRKHISDIPMDAIGSLDATRVKPQGSASLL